MAVFTGSGSNTAPSFTFSSDTDTGIYRPGANQIAISTNGTGRVFIDSNGRTGLGIANPAVLLHIGTTGGTPQLRLEDLDTADAYSNVSANNGNFVIQADPQNVSGATRIGFEIDGSEKARITRSGRLLVGTSADTEVILHVATTGVPQFRLEDLNTADAYSNVSASNGNFVIQADPQSVSGATRIGFELDGSEMARIDSSGRLLVGTSDNSGGALLQVNGDRIRVGTAKTPASATATGTAGEICWDASYVYVCTATNTWKRSALSTW